MALGRNQIIGVVGIAVPYCMNFGLVIADKLDAAAFWGGTPAYVSLGLGIILGASAFVKSKWGASGGPQ